MRASAHRATQPEAPSDSAGPVARVRHPTFGQALRFWLKLGFISFGGPAGQIAIMHSELVDRRRWISEARFLNALNYCMLLPGPEAQQLATYIGWLLHRIPGGVAAGCLFVIPSIFILMLLSYVYAAHGAVAWVAAVFGGLKAAVLAVVIHAVIRIGRKSLKSPLMLAVAASAFVAIYGFKTPFPLIVLGAGLIGYLGGRLRPALFDVMPTHGQVPGRTGGTEVCGDEGSCHIAPSPRRNSLLLAVFALLWLAPVVALHLGPANPVFAAEALFFTKAALVTFGGAYAVLAYLAQAGVSQYGWLSGPQMLDGLGLAETTPGPLIMVVQFVGFMAGWNHAGTWPPLAAAVLGGLTATYFTFLPGFLFIFLGGPYIEKFRSHRLLSGALSSITAAVVGVILNLAVWFGRQVLFPEGGGPDLPAVGIGLVAFAALQWLRVGVITVILGAGVLGWGAHLMF
jgi:chromate transporter